MVNREREDGACRARHRQVADRNPFRALGQFPLAEAAVMERFALAEISGSGLHALWQRAIVSLSLSLFRRCFHRSESVSQLRWGRAKPLPLNNRSRCQLCRKRLAAFLCQVFAI
jgi:hypothetical protein